jgi:hypothetical protein
MTDRRRLLVLTLSVALIAGGLAAGIRRRGFRNQIDHEVAQLLDSARTPAIGVVGEADLERLPDPVQRWLRASGVVGTAIPATVRLIQTGAFRLGANKPWMPMHASEYYTTNPPGFLWTASMEMFPLVHVTGRDRYARGVGDIDMRVASIVPVAQKSGGNLNSGALLRYLNETMWFPAALVLPNVEWEPIDESSARATITDAGQSVSAVFVFDAEDHLVNMTADRWNDSEQATFPWSTPITDYGNFNGIDIATAGTGVWKIGADAYEYIRLKVTDVDYDPRDPTRK